MVNHEGHEETRRFYFFLFETFLCFVVNKIKLVKGFVGVHGFKGSGVRGSILNWQLLGKMNICNRVNDNSLTL